MLRFVPSVLGLALLPVLWTATAAADGLTAKDLLRLRSVGAAVVSPDGARIAHTVNVPRDPFGGDNGPDRVELHVAGADGSTRAYVTDDAGAKQVAWRAATGTITFLAKRDGDETTSLYGIPLDGGEAARLFAHETDIDSYAWSPDGTRLYFIAREPKDTAREEWAKKGFNQEVYEETLRPAALWWVDVDAKDAEPVRIGVEGFPTLLTVSPDGGKLALALAPTPLIDDEYMRRRVRVVDAASGATLARFENPGKLEAIAWSPDGQRLAVIGTNDLHDPSAGRLLVGSLSSQILRDVLPGFLGHIREVGWKDAATVMFLADQGTETWLGEVDWPPQRDAVSGPAEETDGGAARVLVSQPGLAFTAISLSDDGGSAAMVGSAANHPNEVFRWDRAGGRPARVSDSNPWLAGVRLGEQEVIRYAARDDLEIEGLLIRPVGEQAGRRYPLILMVHGGPESHHRNGWLTSTSTPGQVAAARGYAVFYTNYRASTGRGVEFSMLDHGDFAGAEFDDLVDAADHLAAIGLVDRAKVGVTGGSYGGYATAWCSTALSEHFAAGVMNVGISNQLSFFGTTDIPNEMIEVHYRKRPWDDWDLFLDRSPIRHVEKARTPLLILHGKDDTRVYPSQSMELYRYLKVYGQVPVRLVLYPGEGHGNRKAAARLDYVLRLLQWMDHYLKGPGGDPPPVDIDYETAE